MASKGKEINNTQRGNISHIENMPPLPKLDTMFFSQTNIEINPHNLLKKLFHRGMNQSLKLRPFSPFLPPMPNPYVYLMFCLIAKKVPVK